jgi:hypothetical protein
MTATIRIFCDFDHPRSRGLEGALDRHSIRDGPLWVSAACTRRGVALRWGVGHATTHNQNHGYNPRGRKAGARKIFRPLPSRCSRYNRRIPHRAITRKITFSGVSSFPQAGPEPLGAKVRISPHPSPQKTEFPVLDHQPDHDAGH